MADAEWLHCVVGHRKRKTFPYIVKEMEKYDVISGKIADDNTNAAITAYMVGTYGLVGSETAGKLLYDEASKLWWDGPSAIAEAYEREVGWI